VKLGVRPEKIRVEAVNGAPPPDWNSVEGVLRVSTFIGVSHQFTIDGPEGKTLTVYAQNLGSEVVPAQGERIRLLWRPEHTFVVQASAPLAEWEEEQ
jgi:spermidine/putrescine transport system ATP-binding protein